MAATGMFQCAKCSNGEYETSEFRATGGFLSKIFDVQSREIHHRHLQAVQIYRDLPSRQQRAGQYLRLFRRLARVKIRA